MCGTCVTSASYAGPGAARRRKEWKEKGADPELKGLSVEEMDQRMLMRAMAEREQQRAAVKEKAVGGSDGRKGGGGG